MSCNKRSREKITNGYKSDLSNKSSISDGTTDDGISKNLTAFMMATDFNFVGASTDTKLEGKCQSFVGQSDQTGI
jgi:hypothetical protein